MATNHIQKGEAMPWTNATGAAVSSGDVVDLGGMIGIALGDIADGASGMLATEEVWQLAKDAVDIAQGAQVNITPAGLITTATDDGAGTVYTAAGKAFAAAASADTTVLVKINA